MCDCFCPCEIPAASICEPCAYGMHSNAKLVRFASNGGKAVVRCSDCGEEREIRYKGLTPPERCADCMAIRRSELGHTIPKRNRKPRL